MSNIALKRWQRPGFKRLLFSVLLAAVCTYLLSLQFLPYELVVLDSFRDADTFNGFHDFDNDGFSESLDFRNHGPTYHYIQVRNPNGGVIDQANYTEPVYLFDMLFSDLTGDHFDEMIAVTQRNDSLYLYVHDIIKKKALISREFLVSSDLDQIKDRRGLAVFWGDIGDPKIYGSDKVLLFAVRTNSIPTYLPRSVYAFDLEKRRIIREFRTHACITWLLMYDLTGDGIDEVIVTGAAYGNMHSREAYRDDRCWLFVLDQHLNPVFEPLHFMEYPAEITCVPVQSGSERFLLVMGNYIGDKNIPSLMHLIDAHGKIRLFKPNPSVNARLFSPVVDLSINPCEIYTWKGRHALLKLDHRLETVKEVSTPFADIVTLFLQDMDRDGKQELICQNEQQLLIYSHELDLLAKFPDANPGIRGKKGAVRLTGPDNPVELGIRSDRDYYHFRFSRNIWYPLLPLIFLVLLTGSYAITRGGGHLIARLNLYIRYFKLCFYNTSESLLIIDSRRKLIFANNNLKQLLQLPHDPVRGDDIGDIFKSCPAVLEKIVHGLQSSQTVKEEIPITGRDNRTEVDLLVEPMRFIYRDATSYLIRLSESRSGPDPQKVHSWSRAVQKMAHDIKTPLSTVTLNLKALQMRLDNIPLPEEERTNLEDDIRMMHTELEHIQTMTRNFLKFSNLDRPHFQAFNIADVIAAAAAKYRPYLNPGQELQANLEQDLKPVWADPQQIELVFHILLENALAAVQGTGLISISASLAQFLDTSFKAYIEIEVADTGPGIKQEDMTRIFEPYFSTKAAGTGMGLAIARKIIEDHGCTIEVHSRVNFGAVFRFTLPVSDETEDYE